MVTDDRFITTRKLRYVSFLFIIGFFGISIFLVRWQLLDAVQFKKLAAERIRNIKIPAMRGSIYSSDGTTLAYSERRFDIFAYLPELERAEAYGKQSREEYTKKLSKILNISKDDLSKILNSGPLWVKIAKNVTFETKDAIVNLKNDTTYHESLAGNFVEYTSLRQYPEKQLASHVVGFYGYNTQGNLVGRGGVEYTWEKSLKSLEGFSSEEVDSFGNTITITDFKPVDEQRGTDIYLTIDLQYQKVLEEELAKAVKKYKAKSGASILMDPKTGKIMALANFPTFDPNEYKNIKDPESFNNRAISVPYEFGSVGKIFTVSGVIENGKTVIDDIILPHGHNGCEYFLDPNSSECRSGRIACKVCTFDKKPQPKMTVRQGLVKSDNIALYETAKTIGKDGLHKYLSAFHMGAPTGIELNESYGLLKPVKGWTAADLVTYSYGHGYEGSLLQLITGVSAVANDGKMMQPYIIKKFVESNGKQILVKPKVIAKPVSEVTAHIVGDALGQVYKNNIFEYYYRDLLNYDIGMKSGTALVPYKNRAGYTNDINSTYVGFDLSPSKSFILAVWLHRPAVGTLSSQNSRVLWIETFRRIADKLGVPHK